MTYEISYYFANKCFPCEVLLSISVVCNKQE